MVSFSQIVVLLCFLVLIIILFFENKDYLSYSVLLIIIAGILTSIEFPEARNIDMYIEAIEWEVVFFLIAMFTIAEILNEVKLFNMIAKKNINKYQHNIRKMFYVSCPLYWQQLLKI